MTDAQRDQIPPAVNLEVADRLASTLEKSVRQPGALPEETRRFDLAKVQYRLAKVEQNGTYLVFRIWHLVLENLYIRMHPPYTLKGGTSSSNASCTH